MMIETIKPNHHSLLDYFKEFIKAIAK
jgi:hypothetical protein